MRKQLSKFLTRYKILYDYQFGFREGHSTTLALIEIFDNILYGLDHGKHVAVIYMHLSKAFDIVDHEILLQKYSTMELEYFLYSGSKVISLRENNSP